MNAKKIARILGVTLVTASLAVPALAAGSKSQAGRGLRTGSPATQGSGSGDRIRDQLRDHLNDKIKDQTRDQLKDGSCQDQ